MLQQRAESWAQAGVVTTVFASDNFGPYRHLRTFCSAFKYRGTDKVCLFRANANETGKNATRMQVLAIRDLNPHQTHQVLSDLHTSHFPTAPSLAPSESYVLVSSLPIVLLLPMPWPAFKWGRKFTNLLSLDCFARNDQNQSLEPTRRTNSPPTTNRSEWRQSQCGERIDREWERMVVASLGFDSGFGRWCYGLVLITAFLLGLGEELMWFELDVW